MRNTRNNIIQPLKTIILSGGTGTRLSEETDVRPKPMVEIGGYPILWHIMNIYNHYKHKEFYIALGYKGYQIKRYFLDYTLLNSDLSINLQDGSIENSSSTTEDWKIHLIDTGNLTETGGRILRMKDLIGKDTFFLTYGDGVSDVNLDELLKFHRSHGKLATVTAVRPPSRFGTLDFSGSTVTSFSEKPQIEEGWINGGFFVLEPEVFDYITDDTTIFERDPLENLSRDSQLEAFKHEGFWQPMDTLRELRLLRSLWETDSAPWKIW